MVSCSTVELAVEWLGKSHIVAISRMNIGDKKVSNIGDLRRNDVPTKLVVSSLQVEHPLKKPSRESIRAIAGSMIVQEIQQQ